MIRNIKKSQIRLTILRGHSLSNFRTWYEILGVSPHSSFAQIRQKYLMLSKTNHPDIAKDKSVDYQNIQAAYKILKNAESRKRYDLSLGLTISDWQKTYEDKTNFNFQFESKAFDEILKQKNQTIVNFISLESKLMQRFSKQIKNEQHTIYNWRLVVLLAGFGIFWMGWITFQLIFLNYHGQIGHKLYEIEGHRQLKVIPIFSR